MSIDENFNFNVNFSGQSAVVLGQGYLPRAILQVATSKAGFNSEKGFIRLEGTILKAFVFQEDGTFKEDPNLVGREFSDQLFPPKWDDPSKKDADEWAEKKLKAAIASHGNGTIEQVSAAKGGVPINAGMFKGKQGFVLNDPPPKGSAKDVFPEKRWLAQEHAVEFVSGKKKISSWPQDSRSARAQTQQAMGTGAGNMLGGGTTPNTGASPFGGGGGAAPENGAGGGASASALVGSSPFGGGGGAAPSSANPFG